MVGSPISTTDPHTPLTATSRQPANPYCPLTRAQLCPADGQVPVGVVALLVDADVEGAVHGLQLQWRKDGRKPQTGVMGGWATAAAAAAGD